MDNLTEDKHIDGFCPTCNQTRDFVFNRYQKDDKGRIEEAFYSCSSCDGTFSETYVRNRLLRLQILIFSQASNY